MKKSTLVLSAVIFTLITFTTAIFAANLTSTTNLWPQKAMVGYVDLTAPASTADINANELKFFNVIIFGFIDSTGNLPVLVNGQGQPATIQPADEIKTILQEESPGTINLISIGGAAYSISTTNLNNPQFITNALAVVNNNNLNGIDLDIESGCTSSDIMAFAKTLKSNMSSSMFLTIAPQFAGDQWNKGVLVMPNGGGTFNFTSSNTNIFNAVIVQDYYSGTYFNAFDPATQAQVNETSPNIIEASYNDIRLTGDITTSCKIVIGIPTNAGGAPCASNLWDTSNYQTTVTSVNSNLKNIFSNMYGINGSQFGGLMGWSLNTDADPNDYISSYAPNAPTSYFADYIASQIQLDI